MRLTRVTGALERGPALAMLVVAFAVTGWTAVGKAASPRAGQSIRIVERDFHISLGRKVVSSGDISLQVRNKGPDSHELIVVRRSGRLPLRTDGLTVDEDVLDPVKPGALEPGGPGSVRELHLHLAPGRYELFCNMSGHYLGGMHADLTVR
jgi:uncharacterized cupredoxin-like copper-binding protein